MWAGAKKYLEKYRLKMHTTYVHGRDEQTPVNKFYFFATSSLAQPLCCSWAHYVQYITGAREWVSDILVDAYPFNLYCTLHKKLKGGFGWKCYVMSAWIFQEMFFFHPDDNVVTRQLPEYLNASKICWNLHNPGPQVSKPLQQISQEL
jgi:hypothetical protein